MLIIMIILIVIATAHIKWKVYTLINNSIKINLFTNMIT
jgi:hypothetical protein